MSLDRESATEVAMKHETISQGSLVTRLIARASAIRSSLVGMALMVGLAAAPTLARAQVGAPNVGIASTSDEFVQAIDDARAIVREVMAEAGIPGASVAVGFHGRVVWSQGFGFADLEHSVPVTTLTKFRVGSVSKPITAAAMGLLVEQGELDLDAPVQQYVPDFPEKRWPVTVRQLAGHIAGIRHYQGDEFLSSRRYPDVTTSLDIFEDDPLLFEPGTQYSYSSYAWNLLSAVVEGASRQEFLGFMRDNVFEPLEMRHSLAGYTDSIVSHRTSFYERNGEGVILNAPHVDNSYKWAGGGFLSTPEDLIRFGSAHLEPGFLEEGTLSTLFRSQVLSDGNQTNYGIGWRTVTNEEGQHIVSHGGGSVGGTTFLIVNRATGLVVAAVGNLSGGPIVGMARRIAVVFSR